MTQPMTREARTQVVLVVVAIAVGGVVFALAGDFVMGVAVGAAAFALARQGIKVWARRGEDQSGTGREPDREPVHR